MSKTRHYSLLVYHWLTAVCFLGDIEKGISSCVRFISWVSSLRNISNLQNQSDTYKIPSWTVLASFCTKFVVWADSTVKPFLLAIVFGTPFQTYVQWTYSQCTTNVSFPTLRTLAKRRQSGWHGLYRYDGGIFKTQTFQGRRVQQFYNELLLNDSSNFATQKNTQEYTALRCGKSCEVKVFSWNLGDNFYLNYQG